MSPPGGRKKIQPLAALLKSIGARVLTMDAREHDRVAAAISHLPQLIAVSLMDNAARKNERNPAFLQLAAGGFRDMTRIASSPFYVWKDILSNNRDETRRALREFEKLLEQFRKGLYQSSLSDVGKKFLRAKSFRDSIPKNTKGFIHSLHDLFVWVDDKPGTLATMTAALFRSGININDIELLKVREGQGGTFRLSFEVCGNGTFGGEIAAGKRLSRREVIDNDTVTLLLDKIIVSNSCSGNIKHKKGL